MSALFSKPRVPETPPTPPPVPTLANAQADTDVAARQQAKLLARGRSATLMNGGAGLAVGATTKTLLGQ